MLIGNRSETVIEKTKRHLEEIIKAKEAGENELKYAEENSDEKYEKYCRFWINTINNTKRELEELIQKCE